MLTTVQTPCALRGANEIMRTIEQHLGVHNGQTTADNIFTVTEVECLGACVNAPMVQINDDYFEDLTPETTKQLLDALKEAAEKTGAGGNAPGLVGDFGKDEVSGKPTGRKVKLGGPGYSGQGAFVPAPGPLSSRVSCENSKGRTTLLEEPWTGEKVFRTDGEI